MFESRKSLVNNNSLAKMTEDNVALAQGSSSCAAEIVINNEQEQPRKNFCKVHFQRRRSSSLVQKNDSKLPLRRASKSLKVPSSRIKKYHQHQSSPSANDSKGKKSCKKKPRINIEIEEQIEEESSPPRSSFERFCNCTSLHGWKYMASNVNFTLRIGWVAVVLGSMGVAAFFLGYSCNDFLSSTVQTTQDTSR